MKTKSLFALCFIILHSSFSLSTFAQGTAFTYQGRLTDGGNPATGSYDLKFTLHDAAGGGSPVAGPVTNSPVTVSNGLFTVTLDFGGQFPGADRWLEIAVRANGGGAFVTLAPRQTLTATPYAITAGNVTGPLAAAQLTGTVPAAQLAGTYSGAVMFNNAGNSFTGDGTGLVNVNATTLGGLNSASFWQLTGNLGTTPGTHFFGTTDNQPLEIKVNGTRALRVEPASSGAPNLIGGSPVNTAGSGVIGASIGGGGAANYLGSGFAYTNRVDANFGTIGGGMAHTIETNARFAVIGGGQQNRIQDSAYGAMLGGGYYNTIQSNACLATLGGGLLNTIETNSQYATLGGGYANTIRNDSPYAALGGGQFNTIQDNARNATLAGGQMNTIEGDTQAATLSGGQRNTIQRNVANATISGGVGNTIYKGEWNDPYCAVIGGGEGNFAFGDLTTISGGFSNSVWGSGSTISGGKLNYVQTFLGTIGGGELNNCFMEWGTISGGFSNTLWGSGATIGGGKWNKTYGEDSTIGGGNGNYNVGSYGTIGGGYQNSVGYGGGGLYATVPGGRLNMAKGDNSFAAGTRAKAIGTGAFVWADSQDADFAPSTANEVAFRCQAGVIFTDDSSWTHAVHWTPGTASWTFTSDRNTKDRVVPVNESDVLEKIAQLPISEWSYIGFPQRHVGPMAQDFHALFPLNDSETTLNDADLHGVALAAIQGLNQKVEEQLKAKNAEIQELKQRLATLEKLILKTKRN